MQVEFLSVLISCFGLCDEEEFSLVCFEYWKLLLFEGGLEKVRCGRRLLFDKEAPSLRWGLASLLVRGAGLGGIRVRKGCRFDKRCELLRLGWLISLWWLDVGRNGSFLQMRQG